MQITDIHNLTSRLVEEDWVIDFEGEDDEDEKNEFSDSLKEIYERAGEDDGALYEFFTFATNEKGSTGAEYEWDAKELRTQFIETFRGSGRDISEVIQRYFSGYEDRILDPLASDRLVGAYFQWEEYVRDQRPDLRIYQHGPMMYLFKSE